MAEDFDQKTEQATPKRQQQAREKGDVARSRDLTAVIPLWVVFLYFSFGGFMFTSLLGYFRSSLQRGFEFSLTQDSLGVLLQSDMITVGKIAAPLFVTLVLAIGGIHFMQTRFLFSFKPLSPDLGKINPLQGIKRFFSLNTIVETAKGVIKLFVLGMILYLLLKKEMLNFPLLADMDIISIKDFSFGQIKHLLLISAAVLTVFAIADFYYQRWQHNRKLRMTKQEVKDEYKELEGDQRVKARIRSLQREAARKRMMQEVPKADVIITNPTHLAVALKYDSSKMGAPRIIAKGANLIAEKIKEVAKEHRVPVFEDKPLARTLFKLEVGQEIPETLYKAVATILATVYKMKKKRMSA